jgi:hypothetical protein
MDELNSELRNTTPNSHIHSDVTLLPAMTQERRFRILKTGFCDGES